MYDIKQLEEEWKRYRKKKLKPWFIGGLIVILFTVTAIFFFWGKNIDFSVLASYFENPEDSIVLEGKSRNISEIKGKNEKSFVLLDDALTTLEVNDEVNDITEKVVQEPRNILVDIPLLEDENEAPVEELPETRKKMHLEIIESTSVKAYKDVERRFFESHDIDDALFLAQSYFKNGNYKKAEFWALQTNKLDEYNEESLLIFVKSKVKLDRKNEAMAILAAYIKKSDSQEAKKLLYQIENDKL